MHTITAHKRGIKDVIVKIYSFLTLLGKSFDACGGATFSQVIMNTDFGRKS